LLCYSFRIFWRTYGIEYKFYQPMDGKLKVVSFIVMQILAVYASAFNHVHNQLLG
jgi:hypothetical protein